MLLAFAFGQVGGVVESRFAAALFGVEDRCPKVRAQAWDVRPGRTVQPHEHEADYSVRMNWRR